MAGIAQLSALFFQQSLEMGHMGIMARAALALGQRFMHDFTAECLFLMAVKTDIIRCRRCERQNSGKPENDDDPIIKTHYFLSSPG